MKSVMQHDFSQVPKADIPRSAFNRSHGVKTTFNGGVLVPIFVDEALPGDTFNLKTSGFSRLATPIFPVMDNMYMETFYFAVPIRIIWDNFQKMMGEQDNPSDSTDFLVPTMTSPAETGYVTGSLQDYLGMPVGIPDLEHSALFTRAYNLIWNEWFRDQNLQDSITVDKGDGPDNWLDYAFTQRRGKRHDYFTSALPWPQKGPEIQLPLGTQAPITGIGSVTRSDWDDTAQAVYETDSTGSSVSYAINKNIGEPNQLYMKGTGNDPMDSQPEIYADLTNATAATINQLRQAFQIQKMYERDARGGTRYTEIIRSHFGVTSPDARQQRPEYLGGGSSPINIQTLSSTAETDPTGGPEGRHLASLAGIGTAVFSGHGFTKSFTEHCILIGLVNVRADLTYQQGLNRMFSRSDRLDFFWPALAHIGEQEVLNKEIYASDDTEQNDMVFGYQERFAEYRYKPSIITGVFRSQAPESLDAWHLSQDFENLPLLNSAFISDNPPIDRVVAVPDEPQFIADFYHKLQTARPMPMFGVPGNIDRF